MGFHTAPLTFGKQSRPSERDRNSLYLIPFIAPSSSVSAVSIAVRAIFASLGSVRKKRSTVRSIESYLWKPLRGPTARVLLTLSFGCKLNQRERIGGGEVERI